MPYLDTGLLYRAVAWRAREAGVAAEDEVSLALLAQTLDSSLLDSAEALRAPEVSALASRVSSHGAVRQALLAWQQSFAARPGGAILDGRDIGTVVCPEAPVKFFITARPEIRARRRWQELQATGQPDTFEAVLKALQERDARDAARAVAPLRPAVDAYVFDTSEKSAADVFTEAVQYVSRTMPFRAS